MSSRAWQERVQDILEAIATIQLFTTDISFEDFASNRMAVQAVLYNCIVIGEAVRNIPEQIRAIAPDIPWQAIADMRNVVAHEYFQVDLEIIWDTLQADLPLLSLQLTTLLTEFD